MERATYHCLPFFIDKVSQICQERRCLWKEEDKTSVQKDLYKYMRIPKSCIFSQKKLVISSESKSRHWTSHIQNVFSLSDQKQTHLLPTALLGVLCCTKCWNETGTHSKGLQYIWTRSTRLHYIWAHSTRLHYIWSHSTKLTNIWTNSTRLH